MGSQDQAVRQIPVSQPNTLGITVLEPTRVEQGGDKIYELRALDKSGNVVATFRQRDGEVTGIKPDVTEAGIEMTVMIGEREGLRALTYQASVFSLAASATSDRDTREFLDLDIVRATLQTDAGVVVEPAPLSDETPYYNYTTTCATNYLLTTPTAGQCCVIGKAQEPTPPTTKLSTSGWTATASDSGWDEPASLAIDGSMSTRWSTDTSLASGQWFQVDMGGCKVVNRIVMDNTGSPDDYVRSFTVYGSMDGTHWNPIGVGTGSSDVVTSTFGGFSLRLDLTMRYFKVVANSAGSGSWWSIHELSVYGWACNDLPRTGWVARGYTPSGTQIPNYDLNGSPQWGGLALDGSASTRFSTGAAQTPGQYLTIDMGSCYVVNEVIMDSAGSPGDYARGWSLSASNDGSTWGASWGEAATGTPIYASVTGATLIKGRYLKIKQTGSAPNWWSIHDLHVYGYPCSQATLDPGAITVFVRPSDRAQIYRSRNPTGATCAAYGTNETCSGIGCFYGPAAFSVATIYPTPAGYYPLVQQDQCAVASYQSPPTPVWSDVVGTNPTGQGCPTGSSNPGNYHWDY